MTAAINHATPADTTVTQVPIIPVTSKEELVHMFMDWMYSSGYHSCDEEKLFLNTLGEMEVLRFKVWKEAATLDNIPTFSKETSNYMDLDPPLMGFSNDSEELEFDINELFGDINFDVSETEGDQQINVETLFLDDSIQPSVTEELEVSTLLEPTATQLTQASTAIVRQDISTTLPDQDTPPPAYNEALRVEEDVPTGTKRAHGNKNSDETGEPDDAGLDHNHSSKRRRIHMISDSDEDDEVPVRSSPYRQTTDGERGGTSDRNTEDETPSSHQTSTKNRTRSRLPQKEKTIEKAIGYWSEIITFGNNLSKYITEIDITLAASDLGECEHSNDAFSRNDLTKWNWVCRRNGKMMELQGRISTCVHLMYLWYDINVYNDILVDKQGQTDGINRVLELSGDQKITRNIIKENQWIGKRLLQHVLVFGWSILLWEEIGAGTIRQKSSSELKELWQYIDNNPQDYTRVRNILDLHISREEAKRKVSCLVGNVCGNFGVAKVIIDSLDTIDVSFLK